MAKEPSEWNTLAQNKQAGRHPGERSVFADDLSLVEGFAFCERVQRQQPLESTYLVQTKISKLDASGVELEAQKSSESLTSRTITS